MSYLFPLAFVLNSLATMGLLIALSLAGKSLVAADIGIVHGATLALFYAFSANARNVILNPASRISLRAILLARLLLLAPLGIAAFSFSVYVAGAETWLAVALILRRCVEWISEVHLSDMERRGRTEFAWKFISLQSVLLIVAFAGMAGDVRWPLLGVFLWALLPLAMSLGFVRDHLRVRAGRVHGAWSQMLPHLGSTAIIGMTVYVFRLLILLLAGRAIAGDLYAAFGIGSVMGSVFAMALGPSLALREATSGQRRFPWAVRSALWVWLALGAALLVVTEWAPGLLAWTAKSPLFLEAAGLSMIGGVVMVFAQQIRARLLHANDGKDVYGVDVLTNILIVASVPYVYFVAGTHALSALYLFNSVLALVFYVGSSHVHAPREKVLGLPASTWMMSIAILLFVPVFFQLTGSLFRDPALLFDSEAALKRLPLPLSIVACFAGIPLLAGYRRAHLSLGVIFFSFVLMLMSSVISTTGHDKQEQGKILLLLQVILPMFGLVLGQIYAQREDRRALFEKAFLYVLAILIPLQLLATWWQGHVLLSPYLYVFSVYQHLQYVPVVLACGYLVALYSLWQFPQYKKVLVLLAPLMALHVAASVSMLALALLSGGIFVFAAYRWKRGMEKLPLAVFLMVIVASSGYLTLARNTVLFHHKFAIISLLGGKADANAQRTEQVFPNMSQRVFYWHHYATNIVSSSEEFLFGHAERPDRTRYPSAHNYYLDLAYNFGALALLPLLSLVGYTLASVYRARHAILARSDLLGLTGVVLFLLLVDNSLKVGLRQPYPGIITFFLWAVLLSRLARVSVPAEQRLPVTSRGQAAGVSLSS